MATKRSLTRMENALKSTQRSASRARKVAKEAPMQTATMGSLAIGAGAALHGAMAAKGLDDMIPGVPTVPVVAALAAGAGLAMKEPNMVLGAAGFLAPFVSDLVEDAMSGGGTPTS